MYLLVCVSGDMMYTVEGAYCHSMRIVYILSVRAKQPGHHRSFSSQKWTVCVRIYKHPSVTLLKYQTVQLNDTHDESLLLYL